MFAEAARLGMKPGRRPGKRYSDNRSFFESSTREDFKDLCSRTGWGRFRRGEKYTNYKNFIDYLQWQNKKDHLVSLNFYNYFGKIYDDNRDLNKYRLNSRCPSEVIENQGRILYETRMPCIYLIRHPLQQFLSYGKMIRHGKDLDKLSGSKEGQGIHSRVSIERYMNDWLEQIDHYENNPNEKYLVRFEYIESDCARLDKKTAALFRAWQPNKRNKNLLTTENTRFLKEKIIEAYLRHYSEWELPGE